MDSMSSKSIDEKWARDVIYSLHWPNNPGAKYKLDEIFAPGADVKCNGKSFDSPRDYFDWLDATTAPMTDKSVEIRSLATHPEHGMSWRSDFKGKLPDGRKFYCQIATVVFWAEQPNGRQGAHPLIKGWYEMGADEVM